MWIRALRATIATLVGFPSTLTRRQSFRPCHSLRRCPHPPTNSRVQATEGGVEAAAAKKASSPVAAVGTPVGTLAGTPVGAGTGAGAAATDGVRCVVLLHAPFVRPAPVLSACTITGSDLHLMPTLPGFVFSLSPRSFVQIVGVGLGHSGYLLKKGEVGGPAAVCSKSPHRPLGSE